MIPDASVASANGGRSRRAGGRAESSCGSASSGIRP